MRVVQARGIHLPENELAPRLTNHRPLTDILAEARPRTVEPGGVRREALA